MARGLEGRALYTDDAEREHFLEILATARETYGLRIHAYVLMGNHYHLVLQTPRANLSEAMQWVNLSYAVWFNRRHGRIGPVFAGRFKAVPVEEGGWVYELSVYVHLNPLRIKSLQLGRQDRSAANQGMAAAPSLGSGPLWRLGTVRRPANVRYALALHSVGSLNASVSSEASRGKK